MASTSDYVSVTDTAKLLRGALKAAFPKVTFSVRSSKYAGGASIDVGWTDGPTEAQVKAVTELYRGATFDGMQDLKEYHSTLLGAPDGSVREVHFGADFIFTNRTASPELLEWLASYALQNGRAAGEQCGGCGNWIPEGDCWTARGDRDWIRFACSAACAARIEARHFDACNW
jgi:hypothetical protein